MTEGRTCASQPVEVFFQASCATCGFPLPPFSADRLLQHRAQPGAGVCSQREGVPRAALIAIQEHFTRRPRFCHLVLKCTAQPSESRTEGTTPFLVLSLPCSHLPQFAHNGTYLVPLKYLKYCLCKLVSSISNSTSNQPNY